MIDFNYAYKKEFDRIGVPRLLEETKPTIRKSEALNYPNDGYDFEGSENLDPYGYWAKHRAKVIANLIKINKSDLIWEVGAGAGGMAIPLLTENICTIAVEPLESGCEQLSRHGFICFNNYFDELAIPDNSLEAVGLFDVLEHLESPNQLLDSVKVKLKKDGKLYITVPAHQLLYSEYDCKIGHIKRYNLKILRNELEKSGFTILHHEFIFQSLVLPAFLIRKLNPNSEKRDTNDYASYRKFLNFGAHVNGFLIRYFSFERLICQKTRLQFGLTLVAVAKHKI